MSSSAAEQQQQQQLYSNNGKKKKVDPTTTAKQQASIGTAGSTSIGTSSARRRTSVNAIGEKKKKKRRRRWLLMSVIIVACVVSVVQVVYFHHGNNLLLEETTAITSSAAQLLLDNHHEWKLFGGGSGDNNETATTTIQQQQQQENNNLAENDDHVNDDKRRDKRRKKRKREKDNDERRRKEDNDNGLKKKKKESNNNQKESKKQEGDEEKNNNENYHNYTNNRTTNNPVLRLFQQAGIIVDWKTQLDDVVMPIVDKNNKKGDEYYEKYLDGFYDDWRELYYYYHHNNSMTTGREQQRRDDHQSSTTTPSNNDNIIIIWGKQFCQQYQTNVPLEERYTSVAGMFNTGTNAMEFHLRKNLPPKLRSTWQVPWGKHRVPAVRLNHTAPRMDKDNKEHVLPIIMIRDPLFWMQSMCKNPYAAKWKRTKLHCPNLVPTKHDQKRFGANFKKIRETDNNHKNASYFPVSVYFDKNQIMHWDSLIHLYNDWYMQYIEQADYPRLIVRFEDMLLHAPLIMKEIAQCAGIDDDDDYDPSSSSFQYQTGSAKSHGSHTNMVKAILKTGNRTARLGQLTDDDLEYARQHLNPRLLDMFSYSIPTSQ